MNDQASRRTFVGTVLAALAALVARPSHALAQGSASAHSLVSDGDTVCPNATSTNVSTYSYDRSARLISITHAVN